MITIAHLMDDFGMGGVTRALTLFDQPIMQNLARSSVIPVSKATRNAPKVEAELIVDHATLSWARLPFLASLRVRNPNARIVHVEHSYTRAFERVNVSARGRFRTMLKLAARLVDDIVCVSEAQRRWLASEVGVSASKLRVIYPWTDRTDLLALPTPRVRSGQPVGLLAYGRYSKVKNFAELIRAMEQVDPSEAHLTVFGDGPDRAMLEALAADLPHVEVHGPCPDPARYLAQCDAVIIPSRYEAFGLVATEARMAARPVIVADIDGLPEQVGAGGCIAPLGTAAEIARAIRWAARTNLAPLGSAARRGVKAQPANIMRGWSQLISEVEAPLTQTETLRNAAA